MSKSRAAEQPDANCLAGSLGACPCAKGATGNVATGDLVHMLHEMGIDTGVDLSLLISCARFALMGWGT